MTKTLFFFLILLPLSGFSQIAVTGKVFSNPDKKPVESASVFLSNSSVGGKTNREGEFILQNVKPGKYRLIVSIIGFETFSRDITAKAGNNTLPDIFISPKTIVLNEVNIKQATGADRRKYYNWFVDEFLGTSELAADCKILNPEALDLDYNDTTGTLTASSADFLQIENAALGYKIKYLLTNFTLNNLDKLSERVHYEGSALFEQMKGTGLQQRRWQRRRQEVYEGSEMHFLRSALNNDLNRQGFRALRLLRYPNPDRPGDSLIEAKIKLYKNIKQAGRKWRDSLSWWNAKLKLPKIIEKFLTSKTIKDTVINGKDTSLFEAVTTAPLPMFKKDIVKPTDQPDIFALGFGNTTDALYITYSKKHHFYLDNNLSHFYHLYDPNNTENTLVDFKAPYAFFDSNGGIISPNSLTFSGVWGRDRVAELLPIDYYPPEDTDQQQQNNIADSVITKLNHYLTTNVAEKAYLQFDKPCYAAGDTMYFKAYVTKGERHKLSDISDVLHVDLINTKNKVDQSIKLQIDSGITWGDFALSDTLPSGNYRVRAYTQWMRNDGEKDFFDKVIPIGSLTIKGIPENTIRQPLSANLEPDLQFFPEGGSLVTGIRSKVAFKATGTNGLGIEVKGKITDNTGKQATTFASAHLGMGYFYLSPEEGKTYKAELTFANGQQDTIGLPAAETNGITLSVNNAALPVASVSIQAGAAFYRENKDKDYALVIYSGGVATTVTCELDSPAINLDILKRRLHTGVTTVTLFTSNGEPLCERLFFVQNYDQLSISLSGGKNIYAEREHSNIRFNVLNRVGDPAEGHFSVSVIDESKVPEDENKEDNILTCFLLTSDLKGYIEQPAYYFADTSATARKNLDILMLTHGYRRFEWKQVLDSSSTPLAWQPEKGMEISGQIKTLFNKPINKGTVTLIPQNGGPVLSSISDDKGMFHFSNLVFTDTMHFVLSAVNARGKNLTKIKYFGDNHNEPAIAVSRQPAKQQAPDVTMTDFIANDKLQQRELLNNGIVKGKMLKEVKIKSKKIVRPEMTKYGIPDQVVSGDKILYGGSLSVRLAGLIHFHRHFSKPVLVVVDDVPMPANFDIDVINTGSIKSIEVITDATASGPDYENVLIINTTHGLQPKDMVSTGVLPIAPMGFYKAREFYSPKYDNASAIIEQRDLRSTIYWNPEIMTDKDGNASFDYYNADGTGTYKVVIEGIDDDGNIGRVVYRYEVK